MDASPKVSVIIINWNGLADTAECLESLRGIAYPYYETTVVDYFEGDALPEIFMQYMPGTDIDTYDNFTAEVVGRT